VSATTATDVQTPVTRVAGPLPEATFWRWTGRQFDPRRNSLNMIRLIFALGVLFHHAYILGGFTGSPAIGGVQVGEWSVLGFFCISGYLIAGSRMVKPLATYMMHRAARIFPAFWVCLLVTAFAFAPAEYLHRTGSLEGFLTQPGVTPINYVLLNMWLRINSFAIGDSLATVPFPSVWNGSLWTLYYEFLCYLLLGALFVFAWWRRSAIPTLVAFVISVVLFVNTTALMPYLGQNPHAANFLHFVPYFLGGACVQMLRRRLPIHWAGAAVGTAMIAVALWWSPENGIHVLAPVITYVLLWVASVVPSPRLIQTNDVSYGAYIYAFPVQQLLVVAGMNAHGVALYIVLTVLITVPLAAVSWLLVERPVMRRAKRAERDLSSRASVLAPVATT
jgi:peptidoglycan/LPS O-acetylase OafA/YrhL